MAKSWSHGEWL